MAACEELFRNHSGSRYERERESEVERMRARLEKSRGVTDWTLIEELINLRTDTLLLEYLCEFAGERLVLMSDDRGYTLVHFAVLALRPEIIQSLVRFARDS